MKELTDAKLSLSAYQLHFMNVQDALLRVKQAYSLINNFVQRASYKKFLTEVEKNLQDIKILLESNEASTLLSTISSQWQVVINQLNLKRTQLQSIGNIDEHDRDIILSLTDTLHESLQLPIQNNNQNKQDNPALVLARQAMIRLAFEETLDKINQIKEPELSPSCFLSYAWGASHIKIVHQVADDLKRAGINVRLDIWHNLPGTSITRFAEEITKTDYVVLMGSTLLRKKNDAKGSNVVFMELGMLANRYKHSAETIQPAMVEGNVPEQSFPPYIGGGGMVVFIDFRNEENYFSECLKLIQHKLLEFSDRQSEIAQLIQSFEEKKTLIQSEKMSQEYIESFAKEMEVKQQAKEKVLLTEVEKLVDTWRSNNTPAQAAQMVGLFALDQNANEPETFNQALDNN